MNYIPVMGLEIHAELQTATKLFCSCENRFGQKPNTDICPVCTGHPGTLPVLNKQAVVLACKAGFALDAKVHSFSCFDRKNYFYPDLPKAYQITQLYQPISTGGHIGNIRINNIHIEEDAGKLIHSDSSSEIDLNRCGVPLIEIVTEPDFHTADEICDFLNELSRRLKYCGVCDCKMEQGSLRVDVNISLMTPDSVELGTRAELKNINSFRSIRHAIEFEIKRQSEILDRDEKVIQETRRFDEQKGITLSMRSKADAKDYRYFPEPDIPPVIIDEIWLERIKAQMPELPQKRIERYTNIFNLPVSIALLLTEDKAFSDFFDECVTYLNNPKEISKLMLGELSHRLNVCNTDISSLKFSAKNFTDLIQLTLNGKINKNQQKEILKTMFETGDTPKNIIKNTKCDIDISAIKEKIFSLAEENKKLVLAYKEGNPKAVDFFIGQIIRTFGKGVNPIKTKELIIEILNTI